MPLRPASALRGLLACAVLAAPAAAQPAADRVFVHCAVAQGNGFNWAATLGWLAAEVDAAALAAERFEAEAPGRRALVELDCFVGSSSGGFVGALYDALLRNPAFGGPGPRGHEATRAVARALMFLALSSNLDSQNVGLLLSAVPAWLGIGDADSRGGWPAYWRGAVLPGPTARTFGRWIRGAAAYEPAWYDELLAAAPEALAPLPSRPGALDPDPARAEALRLAAARARRILDRGLAGDAPEVDTIGDGFCATFFAQPLAPGARPPFNFDALRLVAGCNAATAARLAASRGLAAALGGDRRMATALALAAAPDWPTLLNASGREPGLLPQLSGPLDAPPVGLAELWTFTDDGFAPWRPEADHLVLGGYPPPTLQAWIGAALLGDRLERRAADGVEVRGRLAVFGRTEDRANPDLSFAQRSMTGFFTAFPTTGDPTDRDPTLAAFYAWLDAFCAALPWPGAAFETGFFRMDWNLGRLPAAASGRSQILAAKGWNLARVQADPARAAALGPAFSGGFLFEPMDAERFVPTPGPAGETCRPGGGVSS
jgi:hypothetical protein